MIEWMIWWMNGWIKHVTVLVVYCHQASKEGRKMNDWMNQWMDKWLDEWLDRWWNERFDEWMDESNTCQSWLCTAIRSLGRGEKRTNGWTSQRPYLLSSHLCASRFAIASVCPSVHGQYLSPTVSPLKTLLAAVVHVQQTYLKARIPIKAPLDVP